jgi:WD40 repeat protein
MGNKNSKTGPGQNLPQTIEQADWADSLFIGGQGRLMRLSGSPKKLTKDYRQIMAIGFCSMVKTSDNKYLFLYDNSGS